MSKSNTKIKYMVAQMYDFGRKIYVNDTTIVNDNMYGCFTRNPDEKFIIKNIA